MSVTIEQLVAYSHSFVRFWKHGGVKCEIGKVFGCLELFLLHHAAFGFMCCNGNNG